MVITSYTTGALIKKNGTVMRWLINIGMVLMTASLGLCIFFYSKSIYVFIGSLTLSSIGTGLAPSLPQHDDFRVCTAGTARHDHLHL
ncbi:hypothetical protein LJK88_33915 [Paenibacillus sp. P26]|nr:hypothetical protein LJK88_33915 [Paenibacillus sp. P26]